MSQPIDQIAEVLKAHTWWLAGNLGVPGMQDWTTYKCYCGWNGDNPHAHVAEAVMEQLGLTPKTPRRELTRQEARNLYDRKVRELSPDPVILARLDELQREETDDDDEALLRKRVI
jgi:hypothetical protein